jgi:hypothetical protein
VETSTDTADGSNCREVEGGKQWEMMQAVDWMCALVCVGFLVETSTDIADCSEGREVEGGGGGWGCGSFQTSKLLVLQMCDQRTVQHLTDDNCGCIVFSSKA